MTTSPPDTLVPTMHYPIMRASTTLITEHPVPDSLAPSKSLSATTATTTAPSVDIHKSKWVKNLSSRPLTEAEVALLSRGTNFAIVPRYSPREEYVAVIEGGFLTLFLK